MYGYDILFEKSKGTIEILFEYICMVTTFKFKPITWMKYDTIQGRI